MRLIDADKFIANLKDYINKPMTAELCATLIELAPTAYDIDKVIEELKKTQVDTQRNMLHLMEAMDIGTPRQ